MQLKYLSLLLVLGVLLEVTYPNPLQSPPPVTLDPDGGYHLTLAIQSHTNEPDDVKGLIENIQLTFENASELLNTATDGAFYFASLNLIIPQHWDIATYDSQPIPTQTTLSYEGAQLRMSVGAEGVHVENANPCGLPGHHIDLPMDLFDESEEAKYGPAYKALVMAWARLRWGVWEEHGFPGSSAFPYFVKYAQTQDWAPTGCNDTSIQGQIASIQGLDPSTTCKVTDPDYPPQSHCRFFPATDPASTGPSSSLSYLPFLPSVNHFCDATNHNPLAPNKHNLYCHYTSVTEVMTSSPDYDLLSKPLPSPPTSPSTSTPDSTTDSTSTTPAIPFAESSTSAPTSTSQAPTTSAPPATVPPLTFTLSKNSRRPLFYMLVDSSRAILPPAILKQIVDSVNTLFVPDNPNIDQVIGQAATFQEITTPWTVLTDELEGFVNTTEEYRMGAGPRVSFTAALDAVLKEVIARKHPYGATLLLLKHGSSPASFNTPTYEADLLAQLADNNVIVNALEIRETLINPKLHLKNVAEGSGGMYVAVDPSIMDIAGQVKVIVKEVNSQLINFKKTVGAPTTLFKSFVTMDSTFDIPLQYANVPSGTVIKIMVTPVDSLDFDPMVTSCLDIQEGPDGHELEFKSVSFEWMEGVTGGNREVIELSLRMTSNTFTRPWTFSYNGTSDAYVVMRYAELPAETPLGIIVTTSAPDNGFVVRDAPLSIYATVTKEGSPLVSLDHVEAILTNFVTGESHGGYMLKDNGPNSVDVVSGDGTYSASLVPPGDGDWWVSVVVGGDRKGADSLVDYVHSDAAVHRLMRSDQREVGCPSSAPSCRVVALEARTLQFAQLPLPLTVTGVGDWTEGWAGRVLDFRAEPMDDFLVRLTWTTPTIFYENGTQAVEAEPSLNYTIRWALSHDALRTETDFAFADNATLSEELDVSFTPPGDLNQVICVPGSRTTVIYFALALSIDGVLISGPSNIAAVLPTLKYEPTTTTTTTLAPSTTPTADPSAPTDPPIPTTPSDSDSTSTGSSPSTKETPEEDDTEYWYATTEGILVLSIFGGGVAAVFLLAGLYLCILNRRRLCPTKPPYENM